MNTTSALQEVRERYVFPAEDNRDPIEVQIGQWIRHWRKAHRLTISGLAKLAGIGDSSLSFLEEATHDTQLETIERLVSYAMGLSLNVYFSPLVLGPKFLVPALPDDWSTHSSSEQLGYYMKKWRKLNDVTIEQFSKRSGLKVSHICHLEQGGMRPRISTFKQVASALGSQLVIEFVDGSEQRKLWQYPKPTPEWNALPLRPRIAQYISTWRNLNRVSQSELAARAGVSSSCIRQLEQHYDIPRLGKLENIAAAMGTDLNIWFIPARIGDDTAHPLLRLEGLSTDPKQQIATYITNWKAANSVSLNQLARTAHVDVAHLCRIAAGKVAPSLDVLEKIAQAMETQLLIDFVPVE